MSPRFQQCARTPLPVLRWPAAARRCPEPRSGMRRFSLGHQSRIHRHWPIYSGAASSAEGRLQYINTLITRAPANIPRATDDCCFKLAILIFANNQNSGNSFISVFFLYYLVMNKDNTLIMPKSVRRRIKADISFFARKFAIDQAASYNTRR